MPMHGITFKPTLQIKTHLDALSERTKLSKKYLLALGEGRIDDLPPGAFYRRNFIKKYAEATGIDVKVLYEKYSYALNDNVDEKEMLLVCPAPKSFLNLPRIIGRIMVVVLGLIAIGYVGLEVRNVLIPPQLIVEAPQQGYVTHDRALTVYGKAEKETRVTINSEEIYTNSDGIFREVIGLQPGLNEIRIIALKKHGRRTEIVRQVVAD
jgi:hypothetical protein